MTLVELIESCDLSHIHEERARSEEYCELVLYNEHLNTWLERLGEVLGQPLKEHGAKPSKTDQQTTKDYGGIRKNQTLFVSHSGNTTVIAMLWPWEDEIHTTLKLALHSPK